MLIAGLGALPLAAIVDYTLTFALPARTTADTGVDSLTHALEAYVSRRANPFSDALALSAMGLIGRHIRTAYYEPQNPEGREGMMLGATEAGLAFSNSSVALVHGMSRPIGAHFHVPTASRTPCCFRPLRASAWMARRSATPRPRTAPASRRPEPRMPKLGRASRWTGAPQSGARRAEPSGLRHRPRRLGGEPSDDGGPGPRLGQPREQSTSAHERGDRRPLPAGLGGGNAELATCHSF